MLRKDSKAIYHFLNKIIAIPQRKNAIMIPEIILNGNKKIKTFFLRGLADADFCFTIKYKPKAYPVVHGTSKSKALIRQCSNILDKLNIQNNIQSESDYYKERDKTYLRHRVYVNGSARVQKFMKIVGFANRLKVEKYAEFLRDKNTGLEGFEPSTFSAK